MPGRTLEDIALETALNHFLCDEVSAEDYRTVAKNDNWAENLGTNVWEPFERYTSNELFFFISALKDEILTALQEAITNGSV